MSSLLAQPYSSRRFAHQASWYSFPELPDPIPVPRDKEPRRLGVAAARGLGSGVQENLQMGVRNRPMRVQTTNGALGEHRFADRMSSSGGASMRINSMRQVLGRWVRRTNVARLGGETEPGGQQRSLSWHKESFEGSPSN